MLQSQETTCIAGLQKNPFGCLGQVVFPFGQVTFSPCLPDGQGPKQAIRQLNF